MGAGGWQPSPPPCRCGGLSGGTLLLLHLLLLLFFLLFLLVPASPSSPRADGMRVLVVLGLRRVWAVVPCGCRGCSAVPCHVSAVVLFCFFPRLPSTNLKPPKASTPRPLLCSHVAGCNLCGGAGLGPAGALRTPCPCRVRGPDPGWAVPCPGLLREGQRCPSSRKAQSGRFGVLDHFSFGCFSAGSPQSCAGW